MYLEEGLSLLSGMIRENLNLYREAAKVFLELSSTLRRVAESCRDVAMCVLALALLVKGKSGGRGVAPTVTAIVGSTRGDKRE